MANIAKGNDVPSNDKWDRASDDVTTCGVQDRYIGNAAFCRKPKKNGHSEECLPPPTLGDSGSRNRSSGDGKGPNDRQDVSSGVHIALLNSSKS
jgi:hypothetical protein